MVGHQNMVDASTFVEISLGGQGMVGHQNPQMARHPRHR